MSRVVGVLLALAFIQGSSAPVIDGRIGDQEWSASRREPLAGGGGEVQLLARGEFLYVAVRGPRSGLASLCVAKGKSVRILHASAAIGDAIFERWGDVWMKRKDFEWTLRDSPRMTPVTQQARTETLGKAGWIANASAAGSTEREFQILLKDVESVGVTFLATSEPMLVSYWPSTMSDDCRTVKIPQGYLPDRARFDPASWQRVVR
jgi:hypothetical protein